MALEFPEVIAKPTEPSFFPESAFAQSLNAATYELFSTAVPLIGGLLAQPAAAFANSLAQLFQPAVSYLSGLGDWITSRIISATANIIPSAQSFQNWITQALATISIDTTAVTTAFVNIVNNQLAPVLRNAFASLDNFANSVTLSVNTNLENWYNLINRNVVQYGEVIQQEIGALLSNSTYVYNHVASIGAFFLDIKNNYLTPILNAVSGGITATLDNLGPDILNGFNTLIDQGIARIENTAATITLGSQQLIQSTLLQLGEVEQFISTEFRYWVGQEGEYIINSLRGVRADAGIISDLIMNSFTQFDNEIAGIALQSQQYYENLTNTINDGWVRTHDAIVDTLSGVWSDLQTQVVEPAAVGLTNFFGGIANQIGQYFTPTGCAPAQIANFFNGVFNQINDWIQSLCGKECRHDIAQALPDPFNLIQRSMLGVLGAGGGLGISLTLGELVHPLKNLGLSRLAAYFWDMSDFKAVGGDVIKSLNHASTIGPLTYGLNEVFRPHMINTKEANEFYFRDLLTLDEWRQVYARQGIPDFYIDRFYTALHTEPSDRMLLNMLETPGVDQQWIDEKLKARGYSTFDRELILGYALYSKLRDEFSELKSNYEYAYIQGYISGEDYAQALQWTGRSDREIGWAIFAANRKEESQRQKEDIDIIVTAFRSGQLSQQDFEDMIRNLPLIPARQDNLIAKELARKKNTDAVNRITRQARLSSSEILKGYDLGLLEEQEAITRLQLLNYTPEDSTLIVQVHKAEEAARETDEQQKAAIAAEKATAREEQKLAVEYIRFIIKQMQAGNVSLQAVLDQINDSPISAGYKGLLSTEAQLLSETTINSADIVKPKMLRETEIYKAAAMGLITTQDVIDYLAELGFSPEDITVKLQINRITA